MDKIYERVGFYTIALALACLLSWLSVYTKSKYLTGFFCDNAPLVAVALFTMYTASIGMLISQLEMLRQALNIHFGNTITSIRRALYEMIFFMFGIIAITIAMSDSKLAAYTICIFPILPTLQLFALICMVGVVADTVNALLKTFEARKSNNHP